MIVVIGRVRCAEQNREALLAALTRMQDQSRKEEGCLRYGFFSAVEDPLGFVAVEEWADREALIATSPSPIFRSSQEGCSSSSPSDPTWRSTRSPAPAASRAPRVLACA